MEFEFFIFKRNTIKTFAYTFAAVFVAFGIELPIHKLNVNNIYCSYTVISLLFFGHKKEAHEISIKW